MELNSKQKEAKQQILDWAAKHPRIISLQGPAGTGKTTLLDSLLPALRPRFSTVLLTGMTGKAALRISQITGSAASTLHRVLYMPPNGDTQELTFDTLQPAPHRALLVVDEASMITPDIFADLLKWVDGGVSVLLVGDGYQLPPVISLAQAKIHGESYSVFAHVPGPKLDQVMRNGDEILNVATRLRNEQKITRESRGMYTYVAGRSAGEVAQLHADLLLLKSDHALITWRNAVRMNLNALTRAKLGREGEPGVGEPVLFCKNGYGVLNGEVAELSERTRGPILGPLESHYVMVAGKRHRILALLGGKEEPMDGQQPFLKDDDWRTFVRDKRQLKIKGDPIPITWGYVLTAHKAQGSEFDAVTVYLDKADGASKPFLAPSKLPDGTSVPFYCRWLYTSLTRAKRHATLVMGS